MNHTYGYCEKCKSVNKISIEKALTKASVCGKCGADIKLNQLVHEVNAEGLSKILNTSDKPVVVDFWASWCGPCLAYGPEYARASVELKDAVFLKLNTETNQEISQKLNIRSIPTTIVFKNGKEHKRQSGALNAGLLRSLIFS